MANIKKLARGVEYYPDTDRLLLIICPKCGRENWGVQVATGKCAWCGYDGRELLNSEQSKIENNETDT